MVKLFSIEIRDEDEQEMKIDYPTDIKHIAHIGVGMVNRSITLRIRWVMVTPILN